MVIYPQKNYHNYFFSPIQLRAANAAAYRACFGTCDAMGEAGGCGVVARPVPRGKPRGYLLSIDFVLFVP